MQTSENPVTADDVKAQVEHDRMQKRIRELETKYDRATSLLASEQIKDSKAQTELRRLRWAVESALSKLHNPEVEAVLMVALESKGKP